MTPEEAQRAVIEYRCSIGRATPAEYMKYMAAREILHATGHERMTPSQRGFMAAARRPMSGVDK